MGSVRDYLNSEMQKQAGLFGGSPPPPPRGIGPLAIILPLLALAGGAYAFRDRLGLSSLLGGGSDPATQPEAKRTGRGAERRGRPVKPTGYTPKPGDITSQLAKNPPASGPKGVAYDWLQNAGPNVQGLLDQLSGQIGF